MIRAQAQRGGKGEKGGEMHGRKLQSNSQKRKQRGHPLHLHPHHPHRPNHPNQSNRQQRKQQNHPLHHHPHHPHRSHRPNHCHQRKNLIWRKNREQ
jgi:hypothetical protein